MKTTIDKDFFEKWKNKKVAMWCKKKEYAEEFCKLMHEQGLVWKSGSSCKTLTHWNIIKENTVYEFGKEVFCGDITKYEEDGYTILDFEDYIVKEKMTKKELVKLLVENFTDEYGALDSSGLDFTEFNCSVDISHMKVSGTLVQNNQKVQGDLFQNNQEVQGSLYQSNQEVRKNLFQRNQYVEGDLSQCDQKVQGHLFQSNQDIQGNLWQNEQSVQGDLIQEKIEAEDCIAKSYAEDISNWSKKYGEMAGDAFREFLRKTAVIDFSKRLDLTDEVIDSGDEQSTNNLPAHYNIAGIDTMDLILKICEHNNTDVREGFYLANTLKYLIRYNNKNGVGDLEKAKDYLNRLIDQKTLEDLPFYNVDGQGD